MTYCPRRAEVGGRRRRAASCPPPERRPFRIATPARRGRRRSFSSCFPRPRTGACTGSTPMMSGITIESNRELVRRERAGRASTQAGKSEWAKRAVGDSESCRRGVLLRALQARPVTADMLHAVFTVRRVQTADSASRTTDDVRASWFSWYGDSGQNSAASSRRSSLSTADRGARR